MRPVPQTKRVVKSFAAEQRALNRTSVNRWDLFASHRDRVTRLALESIEERDARICVLGAGNCNDIDLAILQDAGAEVHLVDIDAHALSHVAERQGLGTRPLPHGGVDLTGIAGLIEQRRDDPERLVQKLLCRADRAQCPDLPHGFDLAISCCVLTPLIQAVAGVIGDKHPRLHDVALALRAGHMRTLVDRVRPGGRALFVTEVASSESLPELAGASDDRLPALLQRAILTGEVFRATSPPALVHWIIAARPGGARLEPPGLVGPWRWRVSRRVEYLVVALLLRRPAAA